MEPSCSPPHPQSPGQGPSPRTPGCSGAHAAGPQTVSSPHHHLSPAAHEYAYGPEAYGLAQAEDAWADAPAVGARNWFDFSNAWYLKGFLIGAGATLLLTNSQVQKTLIRTTVKLWSTVQGGVEEVKEQVRDIKAEMSQDA